MHRVHLRSILKSLRTFATGYENSVHLDGLPVRSPHSSRLTVYAHGSRYEYQSQSSNSTNVQSISYKLAESTQSKHLIIRASHALTLAHSQQTYYVPLAKNSTYTIAVPPKVTRSPAFNLVFHRSSTSCQPLPLLLSSHPLNIR